MNRAAACWRRISQSPLWRNRQGVAGVWFAVTLPCMIMAAGIGLNVSEWMLAASELQVVADIAAQGGAMQYGSTANAQDAAVYAASLAEANGVTGASSRSWNSSTNTLTDNNITVTIKAGPVVAAHMGVYVTVKRSMAIAFPIANSTITTHTQTATAVAEEWKGTPPACVLAKSSSAGEAVNVNNNGSISTTGCGVASDSTASDAISVVGGTITSSSSANASGSVSALGGIYIQPYDGTVSPSGTTGVNTPDLLSTMTAPTAGTTCNYGSLPTGGSLPNGGSFTNNTMPSPPVTNNPGAPDGNGGDVISLQPGTFCGGINFTNNDTVTFNPGIYYIVDGYVAFSAGGGITSANGVTFVLINSYFNYADGYGTSSIIAPTTGTTAKIAVWQTCSTNISTPANVMGGGAILNLSGAFYAPCGALNLSNNTRLNTVTGGSMSVITSTISVVGSAQLNATSSGSGGAAPIIALVE